MKRFIRNTFWYAVVSLTTLIYWTLAMWLDWPVLLTGLGLLGLDAMLVFGVSYARQQLRF